MHAFNQSLKYDQRMWSADIQGSIAYAKSLTLIGILTNKEEAKMIEGLKAVSKEWETGTVRPPSNCTGSSLTVVLVRACRRRRGHSHSQ